MPTVNSKSNKTASETADKKPAWPAYDSELFWAPYRTASKLLLDAHHSATAMAEINRNLVDEFNTLLRREQDVMLGMSERLLQRFSNSNGSPESLTPESFTELYESAMTGAREFGKAVTEAQTRTMEVLREHVQAAADLSHLNTEH